MKNGKMISPSSLVPGDKLRIITEQDPYEMTTDLEGYLIIVEQ